MAATRAEVNDAKGRPEAQLKDARAARRVSSSSSSIVKRSDWRALPRRAESGSDVMGQRQRGRTLRDLQRHLDFSLFSAPNLAATSRPLR